MFLRQLARRAHPATGSFTGYDRFTNLAVILSRVISPSRDKIYYVRQRKTYPHDLFQDLSKYLVYYDQVSGNDTPNTSTPFSKRKLPIKSISLQFQSKRKIQSYTSKNDDDIFLVSPFCHRYVDFAPPCQFSTY